MLNVRLRMAALKGARVFRLSSLPLPMNFEPAKDVALAPSELTAALEALTESAENGLPGAHREILDALKAAGAEGRARIVLGESAHAHPAFTQLRSLACRLAEATSATL